MAHELLQNKGIGDSFTGTYYAEQVFVKQTKTGKDYTDLILRDRSGSRNVKFWGVVKGLGKGDWVTVEARVEDYQGNPSVIATKVVKTEEPSDLAEYLPVVEDSARNAEAFDEIKKQLKELSDKAKDKTAITIVDEVFGNGKFFSRFLEVPCSTGPYYGRKGGLLANTVRVSELCLHQMQMYQMTDLEKAILIASALLCRIGAAQAYHFRDCVPEETKDGRMVGLGNLTMGRIAPAIKRVAAMFKEQNETMNNDVVLRILHAVASHDNGIVPLSKEALVLNEVFCSDQKLSESFGFIQNDVNEAEEFTAFDAVAGRNYYRG